MIYNNIHQINNEIGHDTSAVVIHAAPKNTHLEVTELIHSASPFQISNNSIFLSLWDIVNYNSNKSRVSTDTLLSVSLKSFVKKVSMKFKDLDLFPHLLNKHFFMHIG